MAYVIGEAIVITFGWLCKYSVNRFSDYMKQIDYEFGRMDNETSIWD